MWLVPPYRTVLNFTKFCETKEDFNLLYDPAVLTDKLISDADWLSVYKVPRVKGKVKLKHVRPELYDACMMLHQKVHQEIPVNNELSVDFARAFAYEHCKSAKEENNPEMYREGNFGSSHGKQGHIGGDNY